MVLEGEFFAFDADPGANSSIYKAGAVIGIDQFLKDDYWELDLISKKKDSVIGKFDFSTFKNMKESQPAAAIRIYNRIIRAKSFELLQIKKGSN
jgi:hypothetical protein